MATVMTTGVILPPDWLIMEWGPEDLILLPQGRPYKVRRQAEFALIHGDGALLEAFLFGIVYSL